ncbi:MAG TPA: helix-turn-helix transcriptional regulator [Thermoanaerobaculia bacterium]|nr:helix-turn-helix transcriptional regulator [Thermoanaerobaculia bacterium]
MASKAALKSPPPLSRALTSLRELADWSQAELAQAAGVSPNRISDYERGHRTVTRELLEELAGLMGFPAEAADEAVHYVRSMLPRLQPLATPGSGDGGERARIERLARRMGQLWEETTRRFLTTLTQEGQALLARQKAPGLWQRMKSCTPSQRRALVEEAPEFRNWALCELICKESEKAAADNASRARELAELALFIAELAPGEASWHRRLQGYAWAHVGNARRVGGDLPGANEAFVLVSQLWAAGASSDPGFLDEAQVLSLEASLRTAQGSLLKAADLIDRALASAAIENRANLLIKKARLSEWDGKYEAALKALQEATPFILQRKEPRQLLMLRHNYASNLVHLGRFEEAHSLLPEIQPLVMQLDQRLDRLRFQWLTGRIAAGLGKAEKAIVALAQVRAEFVDRGTAYDAALVSLELAVLYLEVERTLEVKSLAKQMAPIFHTQGVHREALAALKLFWEAVEKEVVTVGLGRRVAQYLYRAQHNPSLRFEDLA